MADVILSGVVYEVTPMGRVPIEGVRIQSDCFHVFPRPDVVTDSQGFFSFRPVWVCPCSWAPWVDAGITSIWVDKDGYEVPAGQQASIFGRRLDPGVLPEWSPARCDDQRQHAIRHRARQALSDTEVAVACAHVVVRGEFKLPRSFRAC